MLYLTVHLVVDCIMSVCCGRPNSWYYYDIFKYLNINVIVIMNSEGLCVVPVP
jgi:hypothetical protein